VSVFGFDGSQIGVLGTPANPAVAASGPNGPTLSTGTSKGLVLGQATSTQNFGPCPPIATSGTTIVGDATVVLFTFR